MGTTLNATFAPMLFIPKGVTDIEFYKKAFGAIELRRWSNDDGTIHVVELTVGDALFHLHEENREKAQYSPLTNLCITATIGLMVANVDAVMADAIAAGATETSPAQDYDYGYRQGDITDPFGHKWTITKSI